MLVKSMIKRICTGILYEYEHVGEFFLESYSHEKVCSACPNLSVKFIGSFHFFSKHLSEV